MTWDNLIPLFNTAQTAAPTNFSLPARQINHGKFWIEPTTNIVFICINNASMGLGDPPRYDYGWFPIADPTNLSPPAVNILVAPSVSGASDVQTALANLESRIAALEA
ncbi:MAG: hypothetical protein J2P37_35190 [Ktedonobacteraceae bacterium]|nr:hypothetical protein [Ktedonobacteraceae bacterium]